MMPPRKLFRSTIAGKKNHSEDPAPAVINGFLEGLFLVSHSIDMAQAVALLAACLCAMAAAAAERWDPLTTESRVSPAPHLKWEPSVTLPEVQGPRRPVTPDIGHPLGLPQLTELALQNNPKTRQAWYAARAAAAGVALEQADKLPTVTGIYSASRAQVVSATSGTITPWQTRYSPSFSLSYLLFDFGVSDNQIEAAQYRLLVANLTQNRVLQDVVFQVEQTYYLLIGVEALVRVNELSLKNIQTAYDAAQRRRESGLATVADVFRTETQVAQAQLNLTRSRGDLEKARGQLATAVGLPVNGNLRVEPLSAPTRIREVTMTVDTLLERAKAGRPDLVAAEAQARAASASAKAVSRAWLPTVELSAVGGRTVFGDPRPSVSNYTLGLTVRMPLFDGFKNTYATRQAEAQASQAEAARDALYRQTELDVWQSYYDLQTTAGGISSTDAQVKSAEQTAQATLARYQAGFGSILDLITAQLDESNARVQQIQSYLNWYTALARLNFSIGASDLITSTGAKK